MSEFLDSRLEAPELVDDEGLRWLASAGARIRKAALPERVEKLTRTDRPRGMLIIGTEARLVRAVLEPICPVPFMAWPGPGLPAWVGPLDLVVIIGEDAEDSWVVQAGAEAARRGARMLVAASADSELARSATGPDATLLPTSGDNDPTASAIALLGVLGQLGLGPAVDIEGVAEAADLIAEDCSPRRDLGENPGKELALEMADHLPLIWGGTVLANRASRRLGEAVRRMSGIPALAADASEVLAVLRDVEPRDPFADPDETAGFTPVVVLLDADKTPPHLAHLAKQLEDVADSLGVRVTHISSGDPSLTECDVERYVRLLSKGLYGAEYLRIGLGRD